MNTHETNTAPNALDFLENYLKKEDVLGPQIVGGLRVWPVKANGPAAAHEERAECRTNHTHVGVIRSAPDDASRFHVFYEKELPPCQQQLLAKTLQSFMAVTYASLGLDMTALGEFGPK